MSPADFALTSVEAVQSSLPGGLYSSEVIRRSKSGQRRRIGCFRGGSMGRSMSVARWSSDWISENGIVLRRAEGLSKMMALSLTLHLAFFLFVFYGGSFWGRSPGGLQGYQVTLVSPLPGPPSLSVNPASTSGGPSAPPSTTGVQTASAPRPSSPPIATPKPLSPKAPPVKEDPERLQDWWQKKARSIKIPPVQQPKNPPAPSTPARAVGRA